MNYDDLVKCFFNKLFSIGCEEGEMDAGEALRQANVSIFDAISNSYNNQS